MAEDKLIVGLSADIKDLQAKLTLAQKELGTFAGTAEKTATQAQNSFSQIAASLQTMLLGFVSLQAAMSALGASFDRALKLDAVNSSLTAIFNSSEKAATQFQMLSEFADQYGLNLMAVADSYKNFAASANSANVPLEQTDYIFQSVAKAASVLKLSNDDLKGALNALAQMISKGTVQAEELRGQLGERLPGAFNLAAKAMGVTTQELGKMLENGEVLAGDLLPKLAGELNSTFGDQITGKVDNLQASINRLDNSFTKAVQSGNLSKFFKEIVDGANEAIAILESKSWEEALGRIVALGTGNQFLKNQINATTEAQKLLNKELDKTPKIDLTKSFGTPSSKKTKTPTARPFQEDMQLIEGTGEQLKTAKELFDLYQKFPQVLSSLGAEYAKNPFFRDLINQDLNKNLKALKGDIDNLQISSNMLFTDPAMEAYIANMQNVVNMIGGALTQSFESALTSGQNFFKVLGQALKALVARLLAAVAAAAVLSAILNPASLAAAGGFKGILGSLTGFNLGSIGAMGGASNRVVSPVGVGAMGQGSVEFNIMGDKLYGVLKNYTSRLDRLQ